ncbi:hypothetical protein ACLOJK_018397 [Asimina triloba]
MKGFVKLDHDRNFVNNPQKDAYQISSQLNEGGYLLHPSQNLEKANLQNCEAKKQQDEECAYLRTLVKDLETAVVVMACNRADYLERTLESVLRYLFTFKVSIDGADEHVKSKALSYSRLTYMQHHSMAAIENYKGSSLGQFFKQYLEPIKLNDVPMGKHYFLRAQDKYPRYFADLVGKAKPVHGTDAVLKAYNIDGDVRIQYNDQPDFERIARQFGIFDEWKARVMQSSIILEAADQ